MSWLKASFLYNSSKTNDWRPSEQVKRQSYITERRVPELIPGFSSQPAGDVSHKPGGRLPLLSASPAFIPATLKRLLLEHSNSGKKKFRFDSRYRIDFFDSIRQSDKLAACTLIFK